MGGVVVYEGLGIVGGASSQSYPGILSTVDIKSKKYRLEVCDGGLVSRVGGLCPLIAVTSIYSSNFWIAELQVKAPILVSESANRV